MSNNVVITGMSIISPIGITVDTYWKNLLAGKSGIHRITGFDTGDLPVQIAAEITDFDPMLALDSPKEVGRVSRYMLFQIYCARLAVKQAGLTSDQVDPNRSGVIIGSGIGGIEIYEKNIKTVLETRNSRKVSPFVVPLFITNQGPGEVARRMGFMGPNYSVSSACSTANNAFISAYDQIKLGRADIMLTGGAEAPLSYMNLAGFAAARALSRRNDEPEKASRPFDTGRDGFVMGEGGGVFVLEREDHAKARGAKILARIIGTGMSCDASHMTAPRADGLGVQKVMIDAIKEAGIQASDIDYINAHATSTRQGDLAESNAICKLFGSHVSSLKVSATKSMIGHALGGAGALELAACIMTLQTGKIHPTINLESQDPGCQIDCVPNKAIDHNVSITLSNSFGFGGHNTSIALAKS
jgi:3-oxoacyl-[acyl-carrier-protein] synthase II